MERGEEVKQVEWIESGLWVEADAEAEGRGRGRKENSTSDE